MKKIFSIFTFSALMLFVMGCDKIDINETHKPFTPSGGDKTVLIKDFTGVRCNNCPAAAETAHELQHQLGEEKVFILSVHAGPMAQPMGNFPDFLTDEGTAWYGDHDSNPLFSVDHIALTEGNTLGVAQIDAPVSEALSEPQTFDISMMNDYDASTRQLKVEANVRATSDYEGQLYVTLCLVEDSLVGWQTTSTGLNQEYVFRNVFRGNLNGFDGDLFSNGQTFFEDEKTFSQTLVLDTLYNAEQCYVMGYIYDKADGKILQTAMGKIK